MRRAAELSAAEVDAEDRIPEAELLRIASELGLPARYVRQALYELDEPRTRDNWLLQRIGAGRVVLSRAVPGDPQRVLDGLERYLNDDEYFRTVRRRGERATFEPQADVAATVARALRGNRSKNSLAGLHGVGMAVRPLPDQHAHVQLELDLSDRRRNALVAGTIIGGAGGTAVGVGLGAVSAILIGGSAPGPDMTLALTMGGGIVGLGAGLSAGLAGARAWFRGVVSGVKTEAEGLLDRVERREPLERPASPLRRRVERYLGRLTGGA